MNEMTPRRPGPSPTTVVLVGSGWEKVASGHAEEAGDDSAARHGDGGRR
jgi:hypothetical protein